jgi:peptide maturation system protein (TIGR04066 family)
MKNKSVTIYPYSKKEIQLFRYASLLEDIQPVYAISPPGWGLTGCDATGIDGGKPSGIIISEDLDSALQNTDILIISSFENYVGEDGNFRDTLQTAIRYKKPFMLLYPPITDDEKTLLEEASKLNLIFRNFEQHPSIDLLKSMSSCKDLKVPVTLIVGQGPFTGKFETQLGIRQELLSRGYQISQVGSRPYCELFGFHSFPSFMLTNELSEAQKVIAFNNFIKEIEKEENPDLLIIGIPGGVMPVIAGIHNHFGILHVEVSAALEPDNVIYNLYSNVYTKPYFEKSSEFIYNRLNNARVSSFVISNSWIEYSGYVESSEFRVITFRQLYDHQTEDIPAVSILEPDVFKKITDNSVTVLEEFGAINYY